MMSVCDLKARVAEGERQIKWAESKLRVAESNLKVAKQDVACARVILDWYEKEVRRWKRLVAKRSRR